MSAGRIKMGDGCAIAYRLDGPENAPILLLSNSLGTTTAMWEPQMAALTAVRRVLRYDTRGHGASDAPLGAYSIDRLGRDVVELLDALDVERVDFCGLSMGGMIGQWLGWRAPGRIDRLVLANTSAFMGPPQGWDARIRLVTEQGMEAMVEPVIQRWFRSEFAGVSEEVARVRAMLLATPVRGYAGCCAAIRDMDQRRSVSMICAQTLVIGGTSDPATPPEHAEHLRAAIKKARLRLLPAAHLSNIEASQAFNEEILKFLTSKPK